MQCEDNTTRTILRQFAELNGKNYVNPLHIDAF